MLSSELAPAEPEGSSALHRIFAILVRLRQGSGTELRLVVPRAEVLAAGLGVKEVCALVDAGYVRLFPDRRENPGDTGDGGSACPVEGLAFTDKGLERIAGAGYERPESGTIMPERPRWVAWPEGGGELYLGQKVIRRLRHDSRAQIQILEGFERLGWPPTIANPLPGGTGTDRKKTMKYAVWRLNQKQEHPAVRFSVHGGRVCWEIVA